MVWRIRHGSCKNDAGVSNIQNRAHFIKGKPLINGLNQYYKIVIFYLCLFFWWYFHKILKTRFKTGL